VSPLLVGWLRVAVSEASPDGAALDGSLTRSEHPAMTNIAPHNNSIGAKLFWNLRCSLIDPFLETLVG
jgi:hypothetical protein